MSFSVSLVLHAI